MEVAQALWCYPDIGISSVRGIAPQKITAAVPYSINIFAAKKRKSRLGGSIYLEDA